MRWIAWLQMSPRDDTIDHKLANPWSYSTLAHLIEDDRVGVDGESPRGRALCGVRVPAGEDCLGWLGEGHTVAARGKCKRCSKKQEGSK